MAEVWSTRLILLSKCCSQMCKPWLHLKVWMHPGVLSRNSTCVPQEAEHTCQAHAIRELSPLWNVIPTKRKTRKALLSHLETTVSRQVRCQRVSAHHPNKHQVKGRDWVIKQQHPVPEEQSLGMKLHQLPPNGSSLSQRGGGPAATSCLVPALALVW